MEGLLSSLQDCSVSKTLSSNAEKKRSNKKTPCRPVKDTRNQAGSSRLRADLQLVKVEAALVHVACADIDDVHCQQPQPI